MEKNKTIQKCLKTYKQKHYSQKTIDMYARALNKFTAFLDQRGIHRVQDITYAHLNAYQSYLTDKGYAPASLEIYVRSVRLFFKYLEENQAVFINPAGKLLTPRYRRKLMPVPSRSQVDLLLTQPDTTALCGIRNQAILEIAYCCGLRLDELFGLGINDFDPAQAILKVKGKGDKERMLPMGTQAHHWLTKYIRDVRPELVRSKKETALWISTQTGIRLTQVSIQKMVQAYSQAAKIEPDLSIHALRRACATHMLANGAHPIQIQLFLGHETLKTLGQYLRVTITDLKKMHKRSKPGK